MSTRLMIIALILFLATIVYADSKAPTAAPTEERPKALTPFAMSPSVQESLAESPTSEIPDDDDEGKDSSLGSPTSSTAYGPLDKDTSSPSAAAAVGVSFVTAISAAAAATAGYLFF